MTTAMRGRAGKGVGPLKEKTVHAALTKQRIHAIVGQVIDELERRRANGKVDYVKALADEIEKGGIAAWKSLRDLLPRDEDTSGSPSVVNFGQLFAAVAKEAPKLEPLKVLPAIDATAEPVEAEASEQVEW